MVPVTQPEARTFTVMVATPETRTGMRQEARLVQAVEARTVTRDVGGWQERCVTRPANGYASAPAYGNGGGRLLGRDHGHRRHGHGGCCNGNGHGAGNGWAGDGCGPEMVTSVERVWVPNVITVTENVPVTRTVCVNVP